MRSEYKYYVPVSKLAMTRQMILPFVNLDRYAEGRPQHHYTVRSIYFDSPYLRFYDEKVDGVLHRKKVRLRGYDIGRDDSTVFMEIKRKYDRPIKKYRAPMSFAGAKALLSGQAPIEEIIRNSRKFPDARDNARRFLYQVHRHHLRPVVCVIYEREPYLSKTDPSIRITLDKHLRSTPFPLIDDLYREKSIRPCLNDEFILEVKFNDYYPAWMKPIIGALGVRWTSASKYVLAMDAQGIGYRTRKSEVLSKGHMFPADPGHWQFDRKYISPQREHIDPLDTEGPSPPPNPKPFSR